MHRGFYFAVLGILILGDKIMCTAITFQTKDFYFGRTLDNPNPFEEQVCIAPRNYILNFRHREVIKNHYAFIGMAHIEEGYPLYYDGCNEEGLAIAALNFVGNSYLSKKEKRKENICQFEFLPYLLATCKTIAEVKKKLENLVIVDTCFSKKLPTAELHYLISDGYECITVEPQEDGIKIYKNTIGVLANNPPFPMQMFHLNTYMGLSNTNPLNTFSDKIPFAAYSKGMGGLGLPGDTSSPSRFVRVCFVKMNSITEGNEPSSVNQFFHIMGSVDQQRGVTKTEDNENEITVYTSCMNISKGFYYYTTYDNHQITRISLHAENLNANNLISYPLQKEEQIYNLNM